MPFRYRLEKVLDFRKRKKEEQLMVVQKAQQEVFIVEQKIEQNKKEIVDNMNAKRHAHPLQMNAYDKYLVHLWEKGDELEIERRQKDEILQQELQILVTREQEVKVLEKHKEKCREIYLEEEKNAEMKQLSEIGVQRHFQHAREQREEEELEELEKGNDSY